MTKICSFNQDNNNFFAFERRAEAELAASELSPLRITSGPKLSRFELANYQFWGAY